MIRISAAFLLTLPVAAAFSAAPAFAQLPPPGIYQERLPPVMGGYDDDEDGPPRPGRLYTPRRALPDPDDDASQPPPPRFFRTPDGRPVGYGHQLDPQLPQQQQLQPPPAGAPSRANNDPDALRPPAAVGPAPQGQPPSTIASLPPEDQPETGKPKELPPNLKKQLVDFGTKEPAGTIIIDTPNTYLYLVLGGGKAMRYGIGVGREGFTWAGTERISRMSEWPDWHPPSEMIDRQPYLPRFMAGGPGNPLGARALYLGKTLYRIHGTNQPSTIGTFVSSGCIRLINDDIEDLFSRVQVGTRVVVYPGKPPELANMGTQPPAIGPAPAGPPVPAAPVNAGVAPRNNSSAITSSPLPPVR
ncbi:MAG TPA: L,D-transpeptidase [Pseudolabrys sp.]|nr:L,D-transpeptidase [Pseudolabrys sp.]